MVVRSLGFMALMLFAQAGYAQQGFYFGGFGGNSRYDFAALPAVEFTAAGNPGELFPVFTASTRITPAFWVPSADDEDSAWGALAGYRIFRYAAAEVAYQNLGTLKGSDNLLVSLNPFVTQQLRRELQTTGLTLSGLGIVPLLDHWNVYARLGWLFANQEVSGGLTLGDTTFGTDGVIYGAGTQFDFGAHWSVRLDFQRFENVGEENGIGESDIDLLSLAVLFRL